MITENSLRKATKYGCSSTCKNLNIAVKLEFDCDYLNHAIGVLTNILKDQKNYEIIYNNKNEKITILLFPESISFDTKEESYWD